MNEDQVQVRTIAQFDTAELAVADDGEAHAVRIGPCRCAVALRHVTPGKPESGIERDSRDIGQVVADDHQGNDARDIGCCDAQPVGCDKEAQHLHLLLEVSFNLCKFVREFLLEIEALERVIQLARIDQAVEQHRQPANPVEKPRARVEQVDQLLAGLRILAQQRQVGGSPGDGLEQVDDALECLFRRVAMFGYLLDELRYQPVEQLASAFTGRLQRAAVTQPLKQFAAALDVRVAYLLQDFAGVILLVLPEVLQDGGLFLAILVLLEEFLEVELHARAVTRQVLDPGVGIGVAHGQGNAFEPFLVSWQKVRLFVTPGLDTVLGQTQEAVGRDQFVGGDLRDQLLAGKPLQDGLDRADLQVAVAAAADKLEGLAKKLYLAYATRSQLDVVAHPFFTQALADGLFHAAQGLDGAIVQVAPVDEGPQHFHEFLACGHVTCNDTCLDHGVAFPFACLGLVVLLHEIHVGDQWPRFAERPEARVDPEDKAVDGACIECLDQLPAKAREELFVGKRAPAIGFATRGECEYQVDIR